MNDVYWFRDNTGKFQGPFYTLDDVDVAYRIVGKNLPEDHQSFMFFTAKPNELPQVAFDRFLQAWGSLVD